MANTKMKFIFYFEYQGALGGVVNLWLEIFKELHSRNIDFVFFNFLDGPIHKSMAEVGMGKYLFDIPSFDWSTIKEVVSEKDVIVITGFDYFLNRFMSVNPKVIYYNVSQYVGHISSYKFGVNFKFLGKKFIQKIDQNHAFIAMDINTMEEVPREFGYKIENKQYLPLCVNSNFSNHYVYSGRETLSIGYIGRSVDWKMMPLLKVMEDLYKLNVKVEFHLIISSYEEASKFIPFDSFADLFTYHIKESLTYRDLDKYLDIARIDIGIAMGTAALDFAKHHIPTILVDYASKKFADYYKYIWLYQTEDFCLGNNISDKYFPSPNGFTMEELIHNIQQDKSFLNEKSKQSYHYVNHYHNTLYTVNRLLEIAEKTSFHLQDSRPYVPYFWRFHALLRKIFK